jgi:hypothetical protein
MKKLILLALAASLAPGVFARDLDDFSDEEISVFCQGQWKAAKATASERDKGTSEDTALERLEGGLNDSNLGYKAKHVFRTTVKGAYVNSEMSPSKYAAFVQSSCMNGFKGR